MDHHQPGTRSFIPRAAPVCASVPTESFMRLSISSTTGSRFELSVHRGETVEVLRRRLSQKLRVPKERFVLLHKETRLSTGTLHDLGIVDGSKLTLVPTIEAGLLSSQPSRREQTIMQALESLTETQVSDFLSGRSPLTLALRVGEHMMFVQLQLAPQSAAGQQQSHLITQRAGRVGVEQVHAAKCGSTRLPYPSPAQLSSNTPAQPSPAQLSSNTPAQPSPAQLSSNTPAQPSPAQLSSNTPAQPSPAQLSSNTSASPALVSPHTPSSTSHVTNLSPSPSAPPCSTNPTCSSPAPQSPTPATTYPEGDCSVAGTPTSNKTAAGEPGAVIESFVSHAPGVFSGTFSGTLPPAGQDSTSTGVKSSRRGINTIFQILNDLLSATRHYQGAPLSLSQLLCRPPSTPTSSTPSTPTSPFPPPSPLTPDLVSTATSGPLTDHISQEQSHSCKPAGLCSSQSEEENQSLRCKLERLQMLMHQRRLRRRARRDTRTSHPYPPHHHQPWSPGRDKASRHSNGSLSSSESSSLDDLELQWKPEIPTDLLMA
ncbi:midnolin-like isoform X2 [Oncorhynchus keta]|uniref:midnolin-like isoform X2 n=1 Tax=Oncorhynchus keta TaxID=8018 RepID=UPI00227D1FC7|nr:midnolin-like isoform X2 [Oncorhynchus keta]